MKFGVWYGIENYWKDVTCIVREWIDDKTLTIPKGDHQRAAILGDHMPNILKNIKVIIDNKETIYKADETVTITLPGDYSEICSPKFWYDKNITEPEEILKHIHQNLLFSGGSMLQEYPEQLMAVRFIRSDAKVLEIGSNIGRNTLTIATILDDDTNLVTLECNPKSVKILLKNRNDNRYSFHIEDAALSKRRLIQKGWHTMPSDVDLPQYNVVKIIDFRELGGKYKIKFDTLVLDCEGAFYYIIKDMPEILENITLIVMENDYFDLNHKQTIDKMLIESGFKVIFTQALIWEGHAPCCKEFFYEVWKKSESIDNSIDVPRDRSSIGVDVPRERSSIDDSIVVNIAS